MKYKNLTIIGTSHVSLQSVKEIKETIKSLEPEAVAVELDHVRLQSLMSKQKNKINLQDILKIGITGYFFAVLGGWAQKKVGEIVRVQPGADMKTAVVVAHKQGAQVYLVDQNIEITLKRLSKNFKFKEKMRVFADIFRMLFFKKSEMEKWGLDKFDLRGVPDKKLIRKMMKQLKVRYPGIYKVLISERNKFMAKHIAKIMKMHSGSVVAVVGAGHEEEMLEDIKKCLPKIDVV
ncbi:hypothetical protein HOK51_10915 [Candidatus Woesearchaeota archaeon]|jgi:pheromone shutdown-related protein TraB|nr:hypothetical protein [Candidatus Woesearchaeota archaeon]MBT6520332.1 hypothetical protein [Candidatus Woesearchaeota archaeon]MBT7368285.1 hypothetical protein [Candidatus Woesearchaeota archaeon]